MTGIKLDTFGGKAPKIFARLLPTDMAQVATNVDLDSGRLEALKGNLSASISPVASYSISSSTKTLFKYSTVWIGSDEDLDFIRSPIAEDPHNRIYVTGIGGTGGHPKMTTAAIVGAGTYYRLGIPTPVQFAGAPTMSPTTSANVSTEEPTSVSYIYTYVSAYGEEGPPITALVSHILEKRSDQTVTVTFPTVVATEGNITLKRLYRTDVTGTFRFVADVSGASYVDNVAEAQLGEAISVTNHEGPPNGVTSDHPDGSMQGLISMPNGIVAGFTGQTVCFSEAFLPHAFPKANQLTMKSDIVAIAPMTNGLLVLTKEKPAMIQGLDPRSMSMTEIDSTLSCVSKNSVVDMGSVVMYASPDGLVLASETGLKLITESILTRDQWQALDPSTIRAYQFEGQYIAFYNDGSEQKGFVFDPRAGKNGYTKLDFYATAGYNDLENDELYLVVGGSVVKYRQGTNLSYTWKSKKFFQEKPVNLSIAKVDIEEDLTNTTYTVTVVNSGGNKFALDGTTAPTLSLIRGRTYIFNQVDNTNSNHPIAFRKSDDSSYTDGVTSTGTPGSSGAQTTFIVPLDAPDTLKYYCTVHGNGMGNSITVSSFATMKLYADGVLKHTQNVNDDDLFPLPSGYKAKEYEIELSSSYPINSVCAYESAMEIGRA